MDRADAIRRTIRRSTAVLLLGVSFLVGSLDIAARGPAMVVAAGATLYLAGSFIYTSSTQFAEEGSTVGEAGDADD